jgi:hypothetical protein
VSGICNHQRMQGQCRHHWGGMRCCKHQRMRSQCKGSAAVGHVRAAHAMSFHGMQAGSVSDDRTVPHLCPPAVLRPGRRSLCATAQDGDSAPYHAASAPRESKARIAKIQSYLDVFAQNPSSKTGSHWVANGDVIKVNASLLGHLCLIFMMVKCHDQK